MEATQQIINDSILESEEDEEEEDEAKTKRGEPLAKLRVFKNEHIPETELPLYLGDNVLGRDPNICSLPLTARSVSKKHTVISISVFRGKGRRGNVDMEALVWDLGSMNGTRKGRFKLTPHVRYALSERETLIVADIPCQYVSCMAGPGDRQAPANQPSLVPESESDSDGEREGRKGRRGKFIASDSFLSPTHQVIPESPTITPSTSYTAKNRPSKRVSFSEEEKDIDVAQPQQNTKTAQAIVDDSEEEEEEEEEKEGKEERSMAPGGQETEKEICGKQEVPVDQANGVSVSAEDGLPACAPTVSPETRPELNLDSDTDVEGEEEEVGPRGPRGSEAAVTLNGEAPLPSTDQFHMDSDTDVEEGDAVENGSKSTPASDVNRTQPDSIPVVQPTDVHLDSDTDVEDDEDPSDSAAKATSTLRKIVPSDVPSPAQPVEFHLDSDTDVEEDTRTEETGSRIEETHSRTDSSFTEVSATSATAVELRIDSDTDEEADGFALASSEATEVAGDATPPAAVGPGAATEILSHSDTDLEEDAPVIATATESSPRPRDPSGAAAATDVTAATALKSDSDTDTEHRLEPRTPLEASESDEPRTPLEVSESDPSDFGMERAPQQMHSTPLTSTEARVEEMETQAFFRPSDTFRSPLPPALGPAASSCSDSQEDEDFVVAETQSFVLESRDHQSSLPKDPTLGLSDSSLADDVELAPTQAYGSDSPRERASLERDLDLEATQAYGVGSGDSSRRSRLSGTGTRVDFALQATQSYIPEACSDTERRRGGG